MSLKIFFHFSFFYKGIVFLLFLTSCQILSPYQSPITPTPAAWKEEDSKIEESPNLKSDESIEDDKKVCLEDIQKDLGNWWEVFEDPVLNELEDHAMRGSYTLWIALEKVIQSRELAMISRSKLYPNVNFAPSFVKSGLLVQNPISNFSSSLFPNAAAPPIPTIFRFIQEQILLPFEISYEVDLWSKLHNGYYAALLHSQAEGQAFFSVLLSLTADVAANYFLLRGFDTQEGVIERNIKIRQKALEINQARFKAGVINFVDVSRQELEVAQAKSDLDDVRRLRGIQENVIAALIGVPASIFSLEYNPLSGPPPEIPKGMPSELLCRRPDIGEAERNLAAAYREIGVAYANFFPSFQLNGAIGLESPLMSQLFTWKARFWQWGWDVLQVIFDAGRNEANLHYHESLFREAFAKYQDVVLVAFKEVENELVNLRQYAAQAEDLQTAIQAAQKTLELSLLRYNRGLAYYLDVVDAEREVLKTEQTAAIVLGNRFVSTVGLIRALGGGWGGAFTTECGEIEIISNPLN